MNASYFNSQANLPSFENEHITRNVPVSNEFAISYQPRSYFVDDLEGNEIHLNNNSIRSNKNDYTLNTGRIQMLKLIK